MKNLLLLLFLCAVLLSACEKTDSRIAEAENYIEQLRIESESVGWTATVSKDNEIVLSKGFGLGN